MKLRLEITLRREDGPTLSDSDVLDILADELIGMSIEDGESSYVIEQAGGA